MTHPWLQVRSNGIQPLPTVEESFAQFLHKWISQDYEALATATECYGFVINEQAWIVDFCTGQIFEGEPDLIDRYPHVDLALELEPGAASLILDSGQSWPVRGVRILEGDDAARERFSSLLAAG